MSPSNPSSRARWTIAELGDRASAALEASGYRAPANGQVRAVPDLRTIRYYTSLGLLDRPLEMRGRTALYGPRHLYQLCAIKRLQAEGRALGEVQAELAGLDDRALARVARISAAVLEAADEEAAAPASSRRAGAFWSAPPAAVAERPVAPALAAPVVRLVSAAKIQLAPGVQLEIASPRGAFDATLRSEAAVRLERAAAPLLEELRRQGLIPGPNQEERE